MANQYFTCTLDTWVSGATIYAQMHYSRSGTYTYIDPSFPNPTMTIAGTTFTDTDFGNRARSGINIGSTTTTLFSKTVTQNGTYQVTFTAGSGVRSDYAGTWTNNVTVTGAATPPTGLRHSDVNLYADGFSVNVAIDSWGSGTGNRYRELQVWTFSETGLVEPRRWNIQAGDALSGVIKCDNSSPSGTLIIKSNTRYTLGIYATNGAAATGSVRIGTSTTLPLPPIIQNIAILNAHSAAFDLTETSEGNARTIFTEYRIKTSDSETYSDWIRVGAAGNRQTNRVTITTLQVGKSYDIQTRGVAPTDKDVLISGIKTYKDVFILSGSAYASVNGLSKQISRMYASVNGTTKSVAKIYASENGVSKRIY